MQSKRINSFDFILEAATYCSIALPQHTTFQICPPTCPLVGSSKFMWNLNVNIKASNGTQMSKELQCNSHMLVLISRVNHLLFVLFPSEWKCARHQWCNGIKTWLGFCQFLFEERNVAKIGYIIFWSNWKGWVAVYLRVDLTLCWWLTCLLFMARSFGLAINILATCVYKSATQNKHTQHHKGETDSTKRPNYTLVQKKRSHAYYNQNVASITLLVVDLHNLLWKLKKAERIPQQSMAAIPTPTLPSSMSIPSTRWGGTMKLRFLSYMDVREYSNCESSLSFHFFTFNFFFDKRFLFCHLKCKKCNAFFAQCTTFECLTVECLLSQAWSSSHFVARQVQKELGVGQQPASLHCYSSSQHPALALGEPHY